MYKGDFKINNSIIYKTYHYIIHEQKKNRP